MKDLKSAKKKHSKKIFKKIALILLSTNLARSQILPHLIKEEQNVLMKALGSDQFTSIAASKTKLIALTNEGRIYHKDQTITSKLTIDNVRRELIPTTPIINFRSNIDCWKSIDRCVICGIGGCYTVIWKTNTLIYGKSFFHKKFVFNKYKDYVFDARTIDGSNFFVTVESMSGSNSAGMLRYDVTSENCYKQWSPKTSSADTAPSYEVEVFDFTKTVSFLNKRTKQFYLFDYTSFNSPLRSLSLPFSDNIVAYEHLDSQADLNVFIVCGNNARNLCAMASIGTSSLTILRRYNQRTNIATTTPAVVTLTVLPMSQFFIVGMGKMMLIFDAGTAPTAPDTNVKNEYGFIVLNEEVQFVEDRLRYRYFLMMPNTKTIQFARFEKPQTSSDTYECHEGCHPQGKCGGFLLRGAECRPSVSGSTPVLCNPGKGSNSFRWVPSNFNDGVKCFFEFTSAQKAKVIGGYIKDASTATFLSNGQTCTNTTYANTKGTNPNLALKARPANNSNSGSNNNNGNGLSTLAVVGIIAAIIVFILLVVIILILVMKQPKTATSKQVFYPYAVGQGQGFGNYGNSGGYPQQQMGYGNQGNNFPDQFDNSGFEGGENQFNFPEQIEAGNQDYYPRRDDQIMRNNNNLDNSMYPNQNEKENDRINRNVDKRPHKRIDDAYNNTNKKKNALDPYPYSTKPSNPFKTVKKNRAQNHRPTHDEDYKFYQQGPTDSYLDDNYKKKGDRDYYSRPKSPFTSNVGPSPFRDDSIFQAHGVVMNAAVWNNATPFQSYNGDPSTFYHKSNGSFDIAFDSIRPKIRFREGQADPLFNQIPPGRLY